MRVRRLAVPLPLGRRRVLRVVGWRLPLGRLLRELRLPRRRPGGARRHLLAFLGRGGGSGRLPAEHDVGGEPEGRGDQREHGAAGEDAVLEDVAQPER